MFDSSNFFELLGIERNFEIDQEALYQNFLELQKLLHPDKLISKSHIEKLVAMEYAAKLNQAYETLKDNKKRAEYLLFLKNVFINRESDNNVKADPMMLNDILELSEDPNIELIASMKEECWRIFKENYSKENLEEAAQAMIKLQYLNKIIE